MQGMAWQISKDDEKRSFSERVDRAVRYFREKHEWRGPVIVRVNPAELEPYAGVDELAQAIAAPAKQPVPKKSFLIVKGGAGDD